MNRPADTLWETTSGATAQRPLSAEELQVWRALPAVQQPDWNDDWLVAEVRRDLAALPGLVEPEDLATLRLLLAKAAFGDLHVVPAGDCAEDPAECTPPYLHRKAGLLEALAGVMRMRTHRPVIRVGRIAGQFAKPRSRPTEYHGDLELPVYRGALVNSPEPSLADRRPDPLRMLAGYRASREATDFLRGHARGWPEASSPMLWTSHEALLLDYELPLLRREEDGRLYLSSTHWPWIGDRTRQLDGAHVALLAAVSNPVACKVGPTMGRDELVALCERLDPEREPGRLTLIARMGADAVGERLPALVTAVRAAGHPVLWLCDPLHGNTVTTPQGRKTRLVSTVVREVRAFRAAVADAGGTAGGLHLETTPDAVTECAADEAGLAVLGDHRTTLCDPRLNPRQALTVAGAWT